MSKCDPDARPVGQLTAHRYESDALSASEKGASVRYIFRAVFTTCLLLMLHPPRAGELSAIESQEGARVIELIPYLGVQWAFRARAGDQEGLFLFDTGGGTTIVSPKTAALVGCKPWGQLTGFRMRGQRLAVPRCDDFRLSVSGLAISAPTAGVFDLMAEPPPGSPELMGSVALDAFAGRAITLDIAHQQLIVESPKSLQVRVRKSREVAVRYGREVEGLALSPFVGVQTKSGVLWMEVDSGSDAPSTMGRHVAALLGLDPSTKAGQDISARLIGGVALRGRTHVSDLIYDGNIGAPTLSNWIVTFDLGGERMWIDDGSESLPAWPGSEAAGPLVTPPNH